MGMSRKIIICAALFLVAACTPAEKTFTGVKVGKPYSINGKIYVPTPDSSYDKVGDASWYGPGFHGRDTANGERFDQNDITAAHPTLPMPSLVKVTNLSNDRSVVVRINDRGPFHSNRIIDLSKRAAEFIDVKSTQPVRVQFLDEETKEYVKSIKGKSPKIDMIAYNESYNRKIRERGNQRLIQTAVSGYDGEAENFAPVQSVTANDLGKTEEVKAEKPSEIKAEVREEVKKGNFVNGNKSQGKYIILAGSFSSQENADKLADSLISIPNHEKLVSVDKVEMSGKDWWRVHVGGFKDKDKAKQALKIIEDSGVHDAILKAQ